MKALALAVCALLVAGTAWAGTRADLETFTMDKNGGVLTIQIAQEDSLTANGGADTLVVDMGDIRYDVAGSGTQLQAGGFINYGGDYASSGDSLTVAFAVGAFQTVTGYLADGYSFNDDPGSAECLITTFGRYWRLVITNVDDAAHGYQITMQFPLAKPR